MKKAVLAFSLATLIFLPRISLAGGLVPCGNPGQRPCQLCDLFVLFNNILNFFLFKIVPALAALIVAIGGFIYIISQADTKMISLAKRIFISVAIGLVIIYGAFLLVGIFFSFIGLSSWTADLYHNWWQKGFFQINCH